MPPNVKVNMIAEPNDDNATYDAIVEASNVKQGEGEEPQLLDNYDVCQDVRVKKARPKRSPKRKLLQLEKPQNFVILINTTTL